MTGKIWHGDVVLVLLGILGGMLLPSLRRLVLPALIVSFSSFVLRCLGTDTIVASMIWPPARNIAFSLKMLAEALKQLVDQPGLRQRLAKQPDRGGIRHPDPRAPDRESA